MSSLEHRLQDEKTLETVRGIVKREFDLELLLKRREVDAIRRELDRGRQLLALLKDGILYGGEMTPVRATRARLRPLHMDGMTAHGGSTMNAVPGMIGAIEDIPGHARRRTARVRAAGGKSGRRTPGSAAETLYARRADGVYVVMTCPTCARTDFQNMQGFVNHVRLKHRGEIGSHDEAINVCGIPVDESEVPLDHASRMRQIDSLPERIKEITGRSAAREKLRRTKPKIKVFEEKVDLDSASGEENDNGSADVKESTPANIADPASVDMRVFASSTNAPLTPAATPTPPSVHPVSTENIVTTAAATITAAAPHTLHGAKQSTVDDVIAANRSGDDNEDTTRVAKQASAAASLAMHLNSAQPSTAPLPHMPQEGGSRFYVKRRVTVGNVSHFIPPEKRAPGWENHSHRWMVYIVGPTNFRHQVDTYIDYVRFYIHPSYRPNDVIDVRQPPFQLARRGWGEFTVRLQIFFCDRRNKPVNIHHRLRLDDTHSGQLVQGAEQTFDLDLDRKTHFRELPTPCETNLAEAEPLSATMDTELPPNLTMKAEISSTSKMDSVSNVAREQLDVACQANTESDIGASDRIPPLTEAPSTLRKTSDNQTTARWMDYFSMQHASIRLLVQPPLWNISTHGLWVANKQYDF
ncbi:yeats family-domain-containing protein [Thamnocephalis sphaerospora]|uniref:Yeats family-domain-containing protein n=1 Tax=Thamnocephalis sphaerospora TaxID=78915 RepID=A0A4P9XHS0_9FUNG|nr:yeats family-domain-containing protein [Thamnocephalis sphaerospora]|eukprot:RKP05166.1 yeats family-domain-containing protein [Thamnocephalis sphaerospora]